MLFTKREREKGLVWKTRPSVRPSVTQYQHSNPGNIFMKFSGRVLYEHAQVSSKLA